MSDIVIYYYTLFNIYNETIQIYCRDGHAFFPVNIADSKQSCTFADNITKKEMSKKETLEAIKEAKEHIASIKNGAQITETVDLSSVDAMLKSCHI